MTGGPHVARWLTAGAHWISAICVQMKKKTKFGLLIGSMNTESGSNNALNLFKVLNVRLSTDNAANNIL